MKLEKFGDGLITKTMAVSSKIDPKRSTVVAIDSLTHELRFVPSVFQNDADGSTTVLIKHQTNEMYMVISYNRTFHDAVGHWAQQSIEHLASKLIVNGVGADAFYPDGKVTRAEFAALLVRAAGLKGGSPSSAFKDVQAGDWFAGAVQTAKERGWVDGMEDGTFHPHAEVTREQMAVMVERFMEHVGAKHQAKQADLGGRFADAKDVSAWAQSAMERLVASKLMEGVALDKLAPKETTTRAQTAMILERFLRHAKLINE
ncbi:S-layer homology domain-containing protein [Paenibacillus tianmuensis]|uniref:S-layer homology domain-containing protein n=1 Tax=Paenibacillus tianmuensis TaxID=624147 RepID=A0A1G4TLN4_9BACL|nr:S-layer homology domain-containing protein [Paenibacillus tianmuensis]SCW82157.1 S-layer homology domain-containing protein [Paenibacillus tianmuensis]